MVTFHQAVIRLSLPACVVRNVLSLVRVLPKIVELGLIIIWPGIQLPALFVLFGDVIQAVLLSFPVE